MFILRKKLPKFSKIIKLQFQLGFSKLTPKLNLTLAPLGLNLVNLANEFNNYKYTLVDENYFVNCRLQINNKTNIYNIKIINIDFSFLTQLIIKNCADNELIKKKLFLS
jgi:ribosomal protein L11